MGALRGWLSTSPQRGKRHFGAALDSKTFTEEHVNDKVQRWIKDIINLARVALSQPHAAYAAYVHGLSSCWSYFLRTVPGNDDLLQPLEKVIHQHLIPALTGRPPCSSIVRDLLTIPVHLGGLNLHDPSARPTSKRNWSGHRSGTERYTAREEI